MSRVAQFTREFLGEDLDDFPDDEVVPRARQRLAGSRERAAWAVVAALACVFVVIVLV